MGATSARSRALGNEALKEALPPRRGCVASASWSGPSPIHTHMTKKEFEVVLLVDLALFFLSFFLAPVFFLSFLDLARRVLPPGSLEAAVASVLCDRRCREGVQKASGQHTPTREMCAPSTTLISIDNTHLPFTSRLFEGYSVWVCVTLRLVTLRCVPPRVSGLALPHAASVSLTAPCLKRRLRQSLVLRTFREDLRLRTSLSLSLSLPEDLLSMCGPFGAWCTRSESGPRQLTLLL